MNEIEKVIAVAKAEIGYLEKKSNSQLDDKTANAGSGNYTKYARDLDKISGFYNGKKNGFAWCDIFVDWCFVEAFGVTRALELLCQPMGSCGAGVGYSANYFKAKNQFYTEPKPGDQAFFKKYSHTGLVYKVDDNYVYLIEGNKDNGVCYKKYSLKSSELVGYGRPKYAEDIPVIDTKPVEEPITPPVIEEPEQTPIIEPKEEIKKEPIKITEIKTLYDKIIEVIKLVKDIIVKLFKK